MSVLLWQLAPYIGGVVLLLLAALGLRRSGATAVKDRMARDNIVRGEKGKKAQAGAKDDLNKGKTPAEIVRENDGKWR